VIGVDASGVEIVATIRQDPDRVRGAAVTDALAHLRTGGADLALVYYFQTRRPPRHRATSAGPGTYSPLLLSD
jgi:hypothetical protein